MPAQLNAPLLDASTRSAIERFVRGLDALPRGTVYAYSGDVPSDATLILVDATAGNETIDLPPAVDAINRRITFKKIDASANTVTLDGDGSETIDGAATEVLTAQWESRTLHCDGSAYYII
jgi:hypothetical protein